MKLVKQCNFPWLMANVLDKETSELPNLHTACFKQVVCLYLLLCSWVHVFIIVSGSLRVTANLTAAE